LSAWKQGWVNDLKIIGYNKEKIPERLKNDPDVLKALENSKNNKQASYKNWYKNIFKYSI